MSAPASRRGILRGLATLPLIGGGVTLIGRPTAAAVPVTGGMLATYTAWLHFELRAASEAFSAPYAPHAKGFIPCMNPGALWHDFGDWEGEKQRARLRAPVILSAAGVPLTSREADWMWGGLAG
ncbi:hypothetical protein [Methylobacterium sp. JK268]